MKRRLAALTNEELSQLLAMRNRKLEAWLAQCKGIKYNETNKHVYYSEARSNSLPVMECLVEIEARACTNQQNPYLAKFMRE